MYYINIKFLIYNYNLLVNIRVVGQILLRNMSGKLWGILGRILYDTI